MNANNIAAVAWKLLSVQAGHYWLAFSEATQAGVILDVVPLTTYNDLQGNSFQIWGANTVTDGDGIDVMNAGDLSGGSTGNVSYNVFDKVLLRTRNGWCLNTSSSGAQANNADNNFVTTFTCQKAGATGTLLSVNLTGTGGQWVFSHYSSTGNFYQSAGQSGNRINFLDNGNGAPAPIINGGGRLVWTDISNVMHYAGFANSTIIADYASSISQFLATGRISSTASQTILNGSANSTQYWLPDGTAGWGVNIAGQDLRFNRIAGTGAVNLGNGTSVNIAGALNAAAITISSRAINSTIPVARFVSAPATSTTACTVGDVAINRTAAYLNVCSATNTWKSIALGTFVP